MIIYRKEKRIETSFQIERYDRFFKRLKGLMLRKRSLNNEGILLVPCSSIHMFFMRFSIDAVFLDKKNCVVDTASALKPWRIKNGEKHAHSVLELPVGTIEGYSIARGYKIELKEEAVN